MNSKILVAAVFLSTFVQPISGQTVFYQIQVKKTPEVKRIKNIDKDEYIQLRKIESGGRWIKTQVYLDKGTTEEYIGEFSGYIDEVVSVYYGKKYSGRQNYRLSIIYKRNGTGLYFFSADRFLDSPNIYFPYQLEKGKWMVTTVEQGSFGELNSNDTRCQVERIHWYSAKLFRIEYRKPSRGQMIEPRTFAEIDGTVLWLMPDRDGFVSEKNNLIEMNK